jgi:hypothetical protein
MLTRYSAFVLLLVLQSTAASAQCWESYSLKSARAAHSEAEKQYSTCVGNQARVENQTPEYCKDEYSVLQAADRELKAAITQYENTREESCLQPDGRVPLFRSIPVPLR